MKRAFYFFIVLSMVLSSGAEMVLAAEGERTAAGAETKADPVFALYPVLGHENAPSFGKTREDRCRKIIFTDQGEDRFDGGRPGNYPLAGLILDEKPLLTDDDIIFYDWPKQTIRLESGCIDRLPQLWRQPRIFGTPFVVVVDGQRVYLGAFWTSVSSYLPRVPTIVLDPFATLDLPKDTIQIQNSQILEDQQLGDPNRNMRIYNALDSAGLILKQGVEDVWGKAVEGAKIGLVEAVQVWGRSDWPLAVVRFKLQARNDGRQYLQLPENGLSWQIEVDGNWYEWIDPKPLEIPGGIMEISSGGRLLDFNTGDSHLNLQVDIAGNWLKIPDGKEGEYAWRRWGGSGWLAGDDEYGTELILQEGKTYRVRVAVTCPPGRATIHRGARLISNPIEIDITSIGDSPVDSNASEMGDG